MANEAAESAARLNIVKAGGDPDADMRVMFSVLTSGKAQEYFSDRRKVQLRQVLVCFQYIFCKSKKSSVSWHPVRLTGRIPLDHYADPRDLQRPGA